MQELVLEVEVSENPIPCDRCGDLYTASDSQRVRGRGVWCPACVESDTYTCSDCGVVFVQDDGGQWVDAIEEYVCDHCLSNNYCVCYQCDEYHGRDESCEAVVEGSRVSVCDGCRDYYYFYCDSCDIYHHTDNPCSRNCSCEAKDLNFEFQIVGNGIIKNDEIHDIELPSGEISAVGIQAIRVAIDVEHGPYQVTNTLDRTWQTKGGSFTKRIAKAMFKTHAFKASPELLAKIGNIAKLHTDTNKFHRIAFTRDLNLAPENFAHASSCWWTDYTKARCALKQEGGMAMRFFDEEDDVIGRAWVMPLDDDLNPVRLKWATAYFLFNVYGPASISKYAPARILAQLTGLSYREIRLEIEPMFINNDRGFLIASSEICEKTAHAYKAFDLGENHNV